MTVLRRALTAFAALFVLALAAAPPALADTTIVVDSTADPGSGGCAPGGATACTLREALELVAEGEPAGVSGAVKIEVEVSGQIELGSGGALAADPGAGVGAVTIAGPGAGALTVSAGGESRVFHLLDGSLTISGMEISDGFGGVAGGGGILAEGDSELHLVGVLMTSNFSGPPGGAVRLDTTGASTVLDSEFAGNHSDGRGGAIEASGPTTVERSSFHENSTHWDDDWELSGGAVSFSGASTLLVRNSTFYANEGGALSNLPNGGGLTIRNSTIAENGDFGVAGVVIVAQSSVFAGNLDGGEGVCLGGILVSQGNNLVEREHGDLGCNWSQGSGDVFGLDAELGGFGFNGGPTRTYPPVSMHSPAINKGENPQSTDQRGFQRPVPDGVANTDVGAVEVQAPHLEVADPPSISPDSDLEAGETLTCDPGTWTTDTIVDPLYTYAWFADAAPLDSGDTHVLSAADAGKAITCRVTVDNGVTGAEAGSAAVELDAAIASLAPTTLDFGSRRVGTGPSEPQALTVTNTGGTDLTVSEVTTSNPEFPVEASACTAAPLGPGEGCAIQVRFAPAATGAQGSFVTVKSDGGEPVASVGGTATEPAFSVSPASFDFGQQRVETTSAPKAFVVTNVGSAPLALGTVTIGGSNPGEFELGDDGCSEEVLAPGGECSVEVAFSPDLTGPRGATLNFPGEAGGTVPLEGTGTAPVFSVSPTSFDFGQQRVDTSSTPKAFVVTNTGTASLTLGDVAIGGSNPTEFALGTDGCSDATLDPGEECTVQVSFSPDLVGPRGANLSFVGDAGGVVPLEGTGTAPAFSVSPSSFDFGTQRIDTTSTAKGFVVTNTGTAPLSLEEVTIGGSNPGEFVLGTDGCSDATLDPGEECTVQVSFSPDLVGPRSASLAFAGDAGGTVPLDGTGTAPALSVAPASHDFGTQRVDTSSTPKAFVVTNTGSASLTLGDVAIGGSNPGEFALGTDGCSDAVLDPGEECSVQVSFSPDLTGPRSAILNFPGEDPGSAELSGTGIAPDFSVTPTSFDFGTQRIDTTSAPKAFVVENTGTASLTLGDVAIGGSNPAEFALGTDGCSDAVLDPGEECTVQVSFSPDLTGPRSAILNFPGQDPGSAELTGTGTAPEFSVSPTSFDFGTQRIDTSSTPKAFVVTNTGTASLTLGDVAIGGSNPGEFALGTDGCSDAVLDPGEECSVQVSFSPDLTGPRSAILNFPGQDPGSVDLTGTGTAPTFSAAPTSIDFGSQLVSGGPSAAQTVTVTNAGTASMAISTVTLTGTDPSQFVIVPAGNECAAAVLDPGEECTVEVAFDPSETGVAAATLSFGGQAPGTVELLGTGIAPALSIEPTSLNFGSHLVGTKSGVQPFLVKNTGSAPAQVFSVSLAGTGSGSFALGPTDTCSGATLAIDATCTVDVSFAPATIGAKAATLDVAGAASVSAPLQGTGIVAKFAVAPTALAFGSREVAAGPTPAQTLTVQNTGSGSLTVESVTPTGPGAAAYLVPSASDKCSGAALAANETCTVAVAFDPAAAGSFAATLSFAGNAPGTVPLSGTGVEPRFAAVPGGHDFGNELVGGSSDPVSFTIANAGSAPLPVGPVAIAGANPTSFHLAQNGCAGLTLAPGQECGLRVSLTPKAIGPVRAQIDVAGNSLELVGNGIEPPPAARLVKPKGAIRVKADGRIKARISCASMVSACSAGLTLTLRRAPVARWSGKVPSGATKTVKLRLNRATRTELVARGKLKMLGLLGSQGGEQRTPLTLTLRR